MSYLNSLIVHTDPKSPVAESYRVLRTNIQFTSVDKPIKTMVVTSSGPGEGKTTTIANLAIAFAQSGSKVLLIDADLRKPRIHKVFHVPNDVGMTTILAQRIEYTECLTRSVVDNLYILASGPIPPNPSELLSSQAMKKFIDSLKNDFDIILIDAPPIGVVTDSAILSTITDGTILVVSSGQVEAEAVQRSKELLVRVNANLLGVVLNKITKENQGSAYNYYYYYTDEAEDNNRKNKKHKSRAKNK
jgi:capsular exopolysaccharide synthesis family protein